MQVVAWGRQRGLARAPCRFAPCFAGVTWTSHESISDSNCSTSFIIVTWKDKAGSAGFPKDKVTGESQETGDPKDNAGGAGFPKGKITGESQELGTRGGFAKDQSEVLKPGGSVEVSKLVEEEEREVAGRKCGDSGLWGEDARGRGPKEAG